MAAAETTLTRFWTFSHDGDADGYRLYRRHYPSAKNPHPRLRQFVGPGEKFVLTGFFCRALFVWRKFLDDSGQRGVNCAAFRNESPHRSSDMIREAVTLARLRWPGERLYTYVDPARVRSPNPGYCFEQAGWRYAGKTKKGLHILELLP